MTFKLAVTVLLALQVAIAQDTFAPLPASDRDAFKTGLENAVSFAEQHRMTELYAIYDNVENITLDRFEAMYGTTPPLTSFIPMKIRFVPTRDFWWVDGCATFSRSPYGKKSMYSTMQARKSGDRKSVV